MASFRFVILNLIRATSGTKPEVRRRRSLTSVVEPDETSYRNGWRGVAYAGVVFGENADDR
jgi:hypothetical protein